MTTPITGPITTQAEYHLLLAALTAAKGEEYKRLYALAREFTEKLYQSGQTPGTWNKKELGL